MVRPLRVSRLPQRQRFLDGADHGLLEQQVEAGFDDGKRIRSVKEYYSWTILNTGYRLERIRA